MGMSFGVIFSVILIIVIVAVSFYAIRAFLRQSDCANVGLFYNGLEENINNAWHSDGYRDIFEEGLPSGVEKVCFGSLSQTPLDSVSGKLKSEIEFSNCNTYGGKANVFIYPPKKACDFDLCSHVFEHVKTEGDKFFCVGPGAKGKFPVKLENRASSSGVFVLLSKAS